ncbi:MAG: hypothetical protein M3Z57_09355 [Candidatus Dormibacteraeota bacterium]|nr:hypothetical protein [Candidatus Dormibacteraeota bacterium]
MEQSSPIDRPAPGHYQGRLSTMLGDLPVAGAPTWAQSAPLLAPRRVLVRARRRRTGQLALPLESIRG